MVTIGGEGLGTGAARESLVVVMLPILYEVAFKLALMTSPKGNNWSFYISDADAPGPHPHR